MKGQILKNLVANHFTTLVGVTCGFILVPFLVAKLGKEAFGLVVFAESLITFFQIFTASVRMALARYATFALSQGKDEEFTDYLSTGRGILLLSTALALAMGLTLSYFFPVVFNVPTAYAQQSRVLFFLITIGFSISIPNIVFWTGLYAKQRFDLIHSSTSAGLIVRALAIFALYSFLPKSQVTIVVYGAVYLAVTWGQNFIVYRWFLKLFSGLQIRLSRFKPQMVRELIGYTGHVSLGSLSPILYENVMQVVINVIWGPAYNAIYGVALKPPTILKRFFMEPSWSLAATFTDLVARNDRAKVKTLFLFYTKVMYIASMPIAFFLGVFSYEIIYAWVGPELLGAAQLMPFYVTASMTTVATSVCFGVTNAYGEVKWPSRVSFMGAIASVALALTLSVWLKMGLVGLGLSAVITTVSVSWMYMPYCTCKVSGISLSEYWFETTLKPAASTAVIEAAILWAVQTLWPGRPFLAMLALGLVVAPLLCLISGYFFILKPNERKIIQEIAGKGFEKLKPAENRRKKDDRAKCVSRSGLSEKVYSEVAS